MNTLKKMYWPNGAKMRANRVKSARKAARLDAEVIKKINAAVGELAKRNEEDYGPYQQRGLAQWQWDAMLEQ